MQLPHWTVTAGIALAELVVAIRAILRPHREPASRFAWVLVIIVAPIVGTLAYLLLGEARISRRRRARGEEVDSSLPRPQGETGASRAIADGPYEAPFALARSINRFTVTGGNKAILAADNRDAIDRMVADIGLARETVHFCFYIWLRDESGLRLKQALIDAARRGVTVRVLADALGSRHFIRSPHWQELKDAGIDARPALPVGGLLWTLIRGRVDLRNHRKQLIVDNRIAWCGSVNAADPEFRIKPRFAPWVDIMTRWEGPVVRQCQWLFASDWMAEHGDDLSALLPRAVEDVPGGIGAVVVGTGPSQVYAAMTACFAELVHASRRELVMTTPYFVPDEQLLYAILSAARRGVRTILVLPRRNDSRIVAAASRSHFRDLLAAGVRLYEFEPGLLHAKTMVVDGTVALVGSANLDRRSFELNFENNILFADRAFALKVRRRQDDFIALSREVTREQVDVDSLPARLWQNLLAMVSPLL